MSKSIPHKAARTTTACACAALMSAAPAWAQQSTVTIYGMLDQAVEHVTGVSVGGGKTDGLNRLTASAGVLPSRWGFRGSEDLGGGMKALFQLESGMSVSTGTLAQNGRIFGRQAFVGLSSNLGTISLGRQYTMRYYGMLDADLFLGGGHGLGSLDSGITTARADNAVSYRNKLGNFDFGANLSFGRDGISCAGEAANAKQCREFSWLAKYDGGSWGLVSAYERDYGGTSTTTSGLTSPDKTDRRLTVNGYLKMNWGQLGAGWLKRDNDGSAATPKSNLYWISTAVPITEPITLVAMLSEIKFDDSPNKAVMVSLRGEYALSKRTGVYLSGVHIDNSGTLALSASSTGGTNLPLPGGSQNAVMAGIKHSF